MSKETLAKSIREIPNFPIPGILFYDVNRSKRGIHACGASRITLYEMAATVNTSSG